MRVSSGRHRDAGVGVIAIAAALFLRTRIRRFNFYQHCETLVLIFSSFLFRTLSATFLPLSFLLSFAEADFFRLVGRFGSSGTI